MNRVTLIGRTTKDIELQTTNSGKSIAKFTLAVDKRKREDGADFIRCTAWGKTAELLSKYVKKGHRVGIAGHIETGTYEKNGEKRYTTDVIVEDMEFLEPKPATVINFTEVTEEAPAYTDADIPADAYYNDDLPF